MPQPLYAITISHQLGAGGTLVGQALAERLGIPFFDREILRRVSEQLHMAEADLAHREERLSSIWDSLLRVSALIDPAQVKIVERYVPSDQELFRLESEMIRRIAERASAVFMGRSGRFVLRDHPRHLKLLVYADRKSRLARLQRLYQIPKPDAERLMEDNDRERAAYIRTFTGKDWTDARLYDLCVNTTSIGMDGAAELAMAFLQRKISDVSFD
jgi:cytidylate kinase